MEFSEHVRLRQKTCFKKGRLMTWNQFVRCLEKDVSEEAITADGDWHARIPYLKLASPIGLSSQGAANQLVSLDP